MHTKRNNEGENKKTKAKANKLKQQNIQKTEQNTTLNKKATKNLRKSNENFNETEPKQRTHWKVLSLKIHGLGRYKKKFTALVVFSL